MKHVYILINHLQLQDGVARAAIRLANELAKQPDVAVTLQSLFRFDRKMCHHLSPAVRCRPFLGFYFRGLAKLVDLIPDRILHKILVRQHYDLQIGYCMELPIKIIAAGTDPSTRRYAWIHGYDEGISLRSSYEKMDKIITVSQQNAARLHQETNGALSAHCCHNLMDDGAICNLGQESIDLPADEIVTFVSVGRLERNKGILRLIECCNRLKQAHYSFRLWIIGDGPERKTLEARVRSLDLCNEIQILGAQQNPYAYMAKADVLVCPSYSEGYSTVCAEAIVLNVPVLTTRVGGAAEIIGEAQAGLLVEQEDDALYEGMKQILDHPEQIAQWKDTLQITKQRFSRENRAKELFTALEL